MMVCKDSCRCVGHPSWSAEGEGNSPRAFTEPSVTPFCLASALPHLSVSRPQPALPYHECDLFSYGSLPWSGRVAPACDGLAAPRMIAAHWRSISALRAARCFANSLRSGICSARCSIPIARARAAYSKYQLDRSLNCTKFCKAVHVAGKAAATAVTTFGSTSFAATNAVAMRLVTTVAKDKAISTLLLRVPLEYASAMSVS